MKVVTTLEIREEVRNDINKIFRMRQQIDLMENNSGTHACVASNSDSIS